MNMNLNFLKSSLLLLLFTVSQVKCSSPRYKFKMNPNVKLARFNCLDTINVANFTVNENLLDQAITNACGADVNNLKTLDASGILYRAFIANNDVLFNLLLRRGADPFKPGSDEALKVSAYDLARMTVSRTARQNEMFADLERKRSPSTLASNRTNASVSSIELKYWARNTSWENLQAFARTQRITNFNMHHVFDDGSNVLMQSIIGNNKILFDEILKPTNSTSNDINKKWGSTTTQPQDFIEHFGFNPVNWPPVMLATALNRKEMLSAIDGFQDAYVLAQSSPELDSRTVARNLPLKYRFDILRIIKRNINGLTSEACMAYTSYAEAIRNVPEDNACLNYHSWKRGVADEEAVKAAVKYLNPARMEVVLNEWDCVNKTDSYKWKLLWAALKETTVSSAEDLKEKIHLMAGIFGMQLDVPSSYDNEITPWNEVLTNPNIDDKLAKAVLGNESLFDVNKLSRNNEPTLIIAAKHGNFTTLKQMVTDRVRLGLNINVLSGAPFSENILHLAIAHVKNDEKLYEFVNFLLGIRPEFLNETSYQSSKNSVEYVVNGTGVEGQRVSYSIAERSQWTPLMYAVALRKNKTAALLFDKGANISHEGLDNITASKISDKRCEAFNLYHQLWLNNSNVNEINSAKLAANKVHVEKMIQAIISELDSSIMY